MRDFSKMRHSGFKAYDIRGIVPTEVNEELAYRVARAYAQLYHPKKISVGYDIRPSSLSIADAVIQGMNDAGVDVYNIGLCGTEMMYFTTFYYGLDGGFMITASHNPANNNGIKIVREKGIPVSADTGLKDIERVAFSSEFENCAEKGHVYTKEIIEDYIQSLLSFVDISKMKPLKIVVNAGNGCANICFENLKKYLPFHFTEQYMKPNATFPHGVPNPMLEECRRPLINQVLLDGADMGVAWDGDFDRCFFIDHKGNFVEGYYMVALLSRYFLNRYKGETIIHDPRVYWCVQKVCKELGGISVESKGGHAFMKETMRKVGGIISETNESLYELVSDLEKEFPCSGEINLPASHVDRVMQAVEKEYAKDAKEIQHIDGLGMDFGEWRFNLRASNTEPLIRFNMETRGDKLLLEEKKKAIMEFIKNQN